MTAAVWYPMCVLNGGATVIPQRVFLLVMSLPVWAAENIEEVMGWMKKK